MKNFKILFLIIFSSVFILSGCGLSIYQAAEKGNINFLKKEIKSGANINSGNITGSTPLHFAARSGKVEMVRFLIKNLAEIEKKNSFMKTPLHLAAEKGHLEVVKVLMANGASIRTRDNHGNSPLLSAAENGHLKMVKFLVKNGAEKRYRNSFNESAVHLARKNGHADVAFFLTGQSADRIIAKTVKDNEPPLIDIFSPLMRGIKATFKGKKLLISGRATDKSGIKNILINGSNIVFTKEGYFKTEVNPESSSLYRIRVTDIAGNFSIKDIRLDSPDKEYSVKSRGNYYALIIGNNNYKNLPVLRTAVNDARVIDNVLREIYGFKTELLINSRKIAIRRALNRLRKQVTKNDNLLIYYAGHGIFDKKVNKAYWLPVDAEKDDDTNWIIADTITTSIRRFAAKHVLIISDSCYSGTLTRSAKVSMGSGSGNDEYMNKMLERPSRTLLASGGNEPVSDGLGGKHSVFAMSLINGLKKQRKSVFTAETLFYRSIKESVAGKSNQVPQYSIIRNSGHGGGDFVFRKRELK